MKDLKNAQHLSVNQLNLIDALRKEDLSLEALNEMQIVDEKVLKNLMDSLKDKGIVSFKESKYGLINKDIKRLQLAGDLKLPVSTFIDERNQKWVIRGEYHKIDDDTDITSIEWVMSTKNDAKVQELLSKAQNRKKKAQIAKNIFADDPPAEYGLNLKGRWTNINTDWKMWVTKITGVRAKVVFAPRIFNSVNIEFPWGAYESIPVIVDIDTLKDAAEEGKMDRIISEHLNTYESFVTVPSKYIIEITDEKFTYIHATSSAANVVKGMFNNMTFTSAGKPRNKKGEEFKTDNFKKYLENDELFRRYVMSKFE